MVIRTGARFIPSTGSNIGYFEVFFITHWYVRMNVVSQNVFDQIMLKIQSKEQKGQYDSAEN